MDEREPPSPVPPRDESAPPAVETPASAAFEPHPSRTHVATPRPVLEGPAPPIVTFVLLAATIGWYARMTYGGAHWSDPSAQDGLRFGANFGPAIAAGEWWRLVSAAFVHFGLMHLGFNMWALWVLGPLAERIFGRAGFLALYLLGALSCSVLSVLVRPEAFSAGASGSVFALIGGIFIYLWLHRRDLPESLRSLRSRLTMIAIVNLLMGIVVPQIDNWGHVGGLLGGIVAAWCLDREPSVWPRMTAKRAFATASFALMLCGAVAFLPKRIDRWSGELASARAAIEEGNAREALTHAKHVLAEDEGNAEALELRAVAEYELGFAESARQSVDAALRAAPGRQPLHVLRAALRFEHEEFEGAHADIGAAAALGDVPASLHALDGKALLALGRWREAHDAFQRALDENSRRSDGAAGWAWLARTLAGDPVKAREELDSAMAASDDDWTLELASFALGETSPRASTVPANAQERPAARVLFEAARRIANGDRAGALAALERIDTERPAWLAASARALLRDLTR